MEEALSELGPERDLASAMLRGCIEGNRRFVAGRQAGCLNDVRRRVELAEAQFPGAVVVACSDSRVPPELLLDQGLGDLFVVRVAGNIVDRQSLGSIEYALRHLGTRLVLVMGHTKCGAVKSSLAEFVESAKAASERMAAREEEEAVALAAFEGLSFGGDSPPAAAGGQQQRQGRDSQRQGPGSPARARGGGGGGGFGGGLGGPRRFFARLLGLLGGEQEAATLVRTASFRDKDHLENPINDIVRAVKPAVKQVVWDLLHQTPASTPPDSASPRAASPPPLGAQGGGAGPHDASGGDACTHLPDDVSCSCGSRSGPGSPPGGAAARAVHFAVDIEALHRRLHLQAQEQEFCLDTHILASTDVTNEVIYENVRRTCATIWHEMEKWLPRDIMESTLMATAVYDLETGKVDFFGLHS